MSHAENSIEQSVLELLELSSLESPFTNQLLRQHRRRLVNRLLKAKKIDQDTAEYLYS